jgi:hypothetical protein
MGTRYSHLYHRLTKAGCPLLPQFLRQGAPTLEIKQAEDCSVEQIGAIVAFVFELELLAHRSCNVGRFKLQVPPGWALRDFHWLGSMILPAKNVSLAE